jgi:hypothetical protein
MPPRDDGLAVVKLWAMLVLWSLLGNSPGPGMVGSLRLRLMATLDLLRSLALPSRGEPRLLVEECRERSAAFIVAAAANDMEDDRGEGVSCGGAKALGCMGEVDMDLEGGREFKSGGMMKEKPEVRYR